MDDTAIDVTETPDVTWQRRLVEAGVAGSAVLVWRGAHDAYGMVKLSALVFVALAIVLVSLWRVLDRATTVVPASRALVPLGAFLGLGLVSVVMSDMRWQSLYGVYGRATGYALYLASGILFLAVLRTVRPGTAWRVVRAIVIGGVLVALYALLQKAGLDPIDWRSVYGATATTSTLGNTNFVSGYIGITLPLAAWLGLTDRTWLRWVGAGGFAVLLLTLVIARSGQGFVAAGLGLGVLVVALILEHGGERRRQLLGTLVLLGVLAGTAVGLGVAGKGPLGGFKDAGFAYRRYYWSAAIEMTADDPVLGVGFDRWGSHYREARSKEAASSALTDITDEPHSVPLNMFASGGVPLGLAYLAFVATIGWTLVQGLRRTNGANRLLLGAVGGGWLAYQVQSAVSIDVPSMPPAHFVLAGLIVVIAGAVDLRERTVPFLVRTVEAKSRRGNVNVAVYPRVSRRVAVAIPVVLALLALWQVSRPLRADVRIQRGGDALASNPGDGLASMRKALHLAPWEPEYDSIIGGVFGRGQTAQVAAAFFEEAVKKDDRRFADTLNAARAANLSNDLTAAVRLYRRALELEPHSVEVRIEAMKALIDGAPKEALEIMERTVEEAPDDLEAWSTLAFAQKANRLPDDAEESYRKAIALLPEDDYEPWLPYATTLRERGEFDRAREVVAGFEEHFSAEHPMDGTYQLARIAEDEGDEAEALRLYDEIVASPSAGSFDADDRAAALRAPSTPTPTP